MAIVESADRTDGEQRVLIPDVSYGFYKDFCEEIGERPIRLSFTDGMLEISDDRDETTRIRQYPEWLRSEGHSS